MPTCLITAGINHELNVEPNEETSNVNLAETHTSLIIATT